MRGDSTVPVFKNSVGEQVDLVQNIMKTSLFKYIENFTSKI